MISLLPRPKIPPYSFFEPISVEPKDWMTSTEFLMGILKKVNEVVAQTNSNTEFIDEYNGKIEQIEADMVSLKQDMLDFKGEVNATILAEFLRIKSELEALVATALNQANAYTDALGERLSAEIEAITLGQIKVYDSSTGQLENLQVVIDNLFNLSRTDAITASEYDALDLSATAYDAYDLTASQYDNNAKSLLV